MLVLGERHFETTNGRAPQSSWLTIPQRGLYTGVMVLGAVGTGKTSACMYPYTDQRLRWKASDPKRKIGGLILEVKGDFCQQVRGMLARAGRASDYTEIRLGGDICYNPLHNDLDPYAVAYAIATLVNNLFGKSKEPFWQQAHTALLKFVILLRRLADGYTTFAEVWARATGRSSLRSFNACARISSMRMIALPIDFIGFMVVLMDHPVTTHALSGPCVPPLFDGVLRTCSNQPLPSGFRPTAVLKTTMWERRFRTSGRPLSRASAPPWTQTSPTIGSCSCGRSPRNSGSTREAVVETAVQRLDLSQKQAGEAYTLAETFESNPRSVWGYVQGLTRLSQRTPWQDGRFTLDRAASRLLTTVH